MVTLLYPRHEPQDIHCPMWVYAGTAESNVVGHLRQQRAAMEAAGVCLHVFDNLSHGGLVSALEVACIWGASKHLCATYLFYTQPVLDGADNPASRNHTSSSPP